MLLVSQCLLGENVRYNGIITPIHPALEKLQQQNDILPFCPEVEGGLSVPRDPCEIEGHNGGKGVLTGEAIVITNHRKDVTEAFISGSKKGISLLNQYHIKYAILKENSPSCGSHFIYDGTFSGQKNREKGIFAELLSQNGITLFNEFQIEDAVALYLK